MIRIRNNLTDKKGPNGLRPFLQVSSETLANNLRSSAGGDSLFEYIFQEDLCRPSWDAESYVEGIDREQFKMFEQFCTDAIARQLDGLLPPGIPVDLAVASRHGLCPLHAEKPRPFKISFRFYLQGAAVVWKDMARLIARANPMDANKPDGTPCPVFDTSVYSVERHMGCILCPKTKTDRRILTPITDHPLEAFFILAPPEAAIRLDIPAPVATTQPPLPIQPRGQPSIGAEGDRCSGSSFSALSRTTISIPSALTVSPEWAARFLELISDARLAQRDEWLKITMACKDNPEDLFEVWDARCAKAPGYHAEENRKAWESLEPGKGRTFATVVYMAKEDAPRRLAPMFRQFLAERAQASYTKLKEEFELRHFKVLHPLCFGVVQPDGDTEFVSRDTLRNMYENVFFAENKPFIPTWLADPSMRSYMRVCFSPPPETVPAGYFNLYGGLRAERLASVPEEREEELAAPFFDHVRTVLCNGDPRSYAYMRKWLANCVKEPGRKSQVAIVLQGEPGVGKNIATDFIRDRVIGPELAFQTADPVRDVFSRFSRAFYRTLWVQLDEATRELHKSSDLLKNAITAPTMSYEKKGVDPITIGLYSRIILSSNHMDPIKIESGDRRYCVFVCSSIHKGDIRYFQRLGAELERDDVARAVYQVLMKEDLREIHFQNDRPITELYQALQEEHIPSWGRFLISLEEEISQTNQHNVSFQGSVLFGKYDDFCNLNALPGMSMKVFGATLSALPCIAKTRVAKGIQYTINTLLLKEMIMQRNWVA